MTTHRLHRRQGLTLIELIVVLVILVALAGILVVMLPSMLGRAHTASGATNIAEINKFVQVYEQLYQSYPRDLDNLADAAGAPAATTYLPNDGTDVVGGLLTTTVPTTTTIADVRTALVTAGITSLATLHADRPALTTAGGSPTFNPYTGADTLTTTATFCYVSEAAVESTIVSDLATNTGDVYVVFGFGKRSSMIGKVAGDAPVHFAETEAANPANVYGRYVLVFRVARGNGTATATPLERAIYVGAVALHTDSIVGTGEHLEEYYNITKGQ